MAAIPYRASLLAIFATTCFAILGCSTESREEMLKRALTDKAMTDADALKLAAKAIFPGAEVSTEPASDGKLLATLSVHGEEESNLPPSVIDTAQGGINNAMKQIQLMMFTSKLASFIENGRQRNLGEVVVTIQTSTFSKGKIDAWVDTYRVRLPENRFDEFQRIDQLDWGKRVAAAEKIWIVELDRFDQFRYQK